MMRIIRVFLWLFMAQISLTAHWAFAGEIALTRGQTVYVPVYSHIYSGDTDRPFLLTAIVSIRNTDLRSSIVLTAVDYYDSEGKLVRKYLEDQMTLKAMASIRFIVKESDKRGGSGANFIVKWQSERPVNPPIMEGVMIGTQMGQGLSFTSRGQPIQE
jgi:hypothetical protein